VISIVIDNPEPVPEDPDLIFGITVPVTRNSNITRLTKAYGNILPGSGAIPLVVPVVIYYPLT
jgi:hypothetical protein